MATSANTRAITFGDGVQDAAEDLRLGIHSAHLSAQGTNGSTALAAATGVRMGLGTPLAVTAGSGLAVTVAAGQCFVPGTSDDAGVYGVTLDQTATLTLATADPANPRLDLVCVTVTDVGSSSSTSVVQVLTGTPAASPTAPSLPATSLALATVLVPAGATSPSTITDLRTYVAALGGITPVSDTSVAVGGPADYVHNLSSLRLQRYAGGIWTAPRVAAFGPSVNTETSPPTLPTSGAIETLAFTTFTCDGLTPVRITATQPGMHQTTVVGGTRVTLYITLDGNTLQTCNLAINGSVASNVDHLGGQFSVVTTPAAGTHTAAFTARTWNATQIVVFGAQPTQPVSLVVEALSP